MFQFRPTGHYHGYVDELNVVFNVTDVDISMDVEMIRSARILNSSFYWKYENPNDTLYVNNTKTNDDPILKIKEMLNRKTLH
jgi:sporulation-control protein